MSVHVAVLAPVAPPAGGVQSHTEALRRRAIAAGMRVSRVAITRSERIEEEDLYYPSGPVDLLRTVRRLQPDVVHLHLGGNLALRLAALAGALTLLPGCRVMLSFHSGGFPTSPRGLAASPTAVEAFALRRLDAAIAVNREIASLFRRYGVSSDRIHVIAPHARLEPTLIDRALPPRLSEFYTNHDQVLISVGLLEPEYCLDLQIEALAALRDRFPGLGLVMIGSGSLHDRLAATIAASPVGDHICLTGDVKHGAVLRAIANATILLRTTRHDGDAVSVREALQLGVPIVASDTGMRPPGVQLLPRLGLAELVEACAGILSADAPRRSPVVSPSDELDRVLDLYRRLA